MTQPSWMWRCLAAAAAVSCLGIVAEVGARFALSGVTTPRRSWAVWVATVACLGAAAPAAVVQLKADPSERIRHAVMIGFGCFDVLLALVVWRWRAGIGTESLGSPVVLVATLAVVVSLVTATLRYRRDLTGAAPPEPAAR